CFVSAFFYHLVQKSVSWQGRRGMMSPYGLMPLGISLYLRTTFFSRPFSLPDICSRTLSRFMRSRDILSSGFTRSIFILDGVLKVNTSPCPGSILTLSGTIWFEVHSTLTGAAFLCVLPRSEEHTSEL